MSVSSWLLDRSTSRAPSGGTSHQRPARRLRPQLAGGGGVSPGSGSLRETAIGTPFTASDKGTHTFSGLVLRKHSKQSITATDTLSSAITSSLSVDVS